MQNAAGTAEDDTLFRDLADNAPVIVWVTAADGRCTFLSALWYAYTGQTEEQALGYGWLDAVHPDDVEHTERTFGIATRKREAFQLDYRLRRSDGTYRWAIDSAKPRFGAGGEFLGFIGSVIDISERKEHEERLKAAHDTFRQLVDRSPFGIYAVDADFRLAQVSDGAKRVFENVRPLIGRDFEEVLRIIWPEPFASQAIGHFRHTLETGETYHAPSTVEIRADIEAREAYDWKVEHITMPDGRYGVVCHFYDLSDRQATEEKIRDLMREVNHRAKNMLALVNAVARQTAFVNPEDFLERFSARVSALAAGQDLLVQTEWTGAVLEELVASQLLHFQDLVGSRISLDGPTIHVSPAAAQTLGMAIHELATNAAKYGALSNATGQVAVDWWLDETGEPATFHLCWQERGGPPPAQPKRDGFGAKVTKTMVRRALSADVSLDFAGDGVVWSLACPVALVCAAAARERRTPIGSGAPAPGTLSATILIVEDDAVIGLDLADELAAAGYNIAGPAASVGEALALIEAELPSFAILDVNLGAETSEPIAVELLARQVPFMSVSGYSLEQRPVAMLGVPHLSKPVSVTAVLREIAAAEARFPT